jgi:putative DNA primase/helicase
MLGKQNIADIQLQELATDRFAKVDLYQKWANICGDLSPDELKRTGLIKMLTGQDYIRAQHKHERAFRFLNFAKLIFAMNTIPECNDATKAWSERIVVVEFPNQFLEGVEGTDVKIIEKLLPEISGIFNWSMIGLKRLTDNEKFSKHRNLEDVREFLATTRNPVFQFVNQFIQSDPNGEETKEFIYSKFLEFAKTNSFPTMASNHFSMKFKEYGPLKMEEGQSRVLDRKKTWKGIKFTGEKQKEDFVNDVNHPF